MLGGQMIIKRLWFAAPIVALMLAGTASADTERFTVLELPIDDVPFYSCIGEAVHVTGVVRIQVASWTDNHGAIHAQLFIRSENVAAVGLLTGNAYRYQQRFMDVIRADSDFAPLRAGTRSRIVLAQKGDGPKLVMITRTNLAIDAHGNVATSIDFAAESCEP
jgi:hypothetical protein